MSWATEHLGLQPDASEREVRRTYARLLKDTRPTENPEGFQRLREAYEVALAQATVQEQEKKPAQPAHVEPLAATWPPSREPSPPATEHAPAVGRQAEEAEPPQVKSVESSPEPGNTGVTMTPFEIAHMLLERVAALPDPDAVRQWLANQSFLWQLNLKHAVADALPWALDKYAEPLFADNLDALWAFFDLDQVTDGTHLEQSYAYQLKRHELSLRWLMVDTNREEVIRPNRLWRLQEVWMPGFMGISYDSAKLVRDLDWVSRRVDLWRNVLRALNWGQTRNMVMLLAWLSNEWRQALAPPLDHGQIRFWLCAHDHTTFSKERLAVVFAQYAVSMMLLMPLMGLLVAIDGGASYDWGVVARVAGWALLIPLSRGLWWPLVHWQTLPEAAVTKHAWWHVLCVPMILLAGGLVRELLAQHSTGLVIWIWASWLVYFRFKGRQGLGWPQNERWWFWVLVLLAFSFNNLLMAGYWVAAVVLALWAWELYKSRPLALERPKQMG